LVCGEKGKEKKMEKVKTMAFIMLRLLGLFFA
jgi:hypothetical protein